MENFHDESITGKLFFNAHLFFVNGCPLKFYLDGYNPYEFHAVSKIIEAYGGRLTAPDKETIIFSEPDRHVQNYYYRYDIKYVYDCIIANKMLDVQKYLLPRSMTPDMFIDESPQSNSTIRKREETLNFQKNDTLNKSSKTSLLQSTFTIKKEPEDEIMPIDGNEKLPESRQIKADKSRLFLKKSSSTGTSGLGPVGTANAQGEKPHLKSERELPNKPELICLSDDSDSQMDNLPDSTKIVNNSHFKRPITQENAKSEDKYKRMKTTSLNTQQSSESSINSNLPSTSNGNVKLNEILNNRNHHRMYTLSSDSEGEFEDYRRKELTNKRPVARKSTTKNGQVVMMSVTEKENTGRGGKRCPYTNEENAKIVEYLIEKNAIPTAEKLAIWKEFEKAKILVDPHRTALNLKVHFQRKLMYQAPQYTDDPRAQKEFKRLLHKKQRLLDVRTE